MIPPLLLHPLLLRPRLRALSLSSPVAAAYPRRYERALVNARQWFDVSEGGLARSQRGNLVALGADRAREFVEAWFDDSVDAIISVIGGMTTAQILEHLPFEELAQHPKLVIGYSDTTTLLSALACHGIPSIYGPALMPQFGEVGGPDPYTLNSLLKLLSPYPVGIIPESNEIITESLVWDLEDDRPRLRHPSQTRRVLRSGEANGWLFVANLGSLLSLAGTRWFPDLNGALLILEEDENECLDSLERMLTHLRMLGIFDRIHGLVFGRLPSSIGVEDVMLADLLLRATAGYAMPMAMGFEVGHVDPFHALPIGLDATLTNQDLEVRLVVHDSLFLPSRETP